MIMLISRRTKRNILTWDKKSIFVRWEDGELAARPLLLRPPRIDLPADVFFTNAETVLVEN